MIKLPIILAAVIAAVPCYAQDVRVFSGDQEHVYGPGGRLVRQSGTSGKERVGPPDAQFTRPAEQQTLSIQQSGPNRAPNGSWSNYRAPSSWWNSNGYQPPKSAWSQ
jgi:hypothetical protein